ncbi:serine hydrolase [Paraglaciecola aquimarina]|uniref:Serine hydrolase n=1 Tax=Paraglaciecola aquimarina TaxID=1235557 RepID=A0ABU3SSB4_9ALTE|nr:serine hydrolase [Paraglaciecola aquimarina]MDU0352907.1 serine hydrolase [Paraglaciecola aquimarina]
MLRQDNQAGLDSRALLVVKDGKIVAESYADGFRAGTPIIGWSMGKSLTSILLGNLAFKQKIQVEQSHLFDAWLEDERRNITLQSLLQMTSGLAFDETYIQGTDATRMLFLQPSASGYALAKSAEHEVDRHFMYSSGTTNILMRLASETLGGQQALIDYFYLQVAKPLGLSHTIFEVDAEGMFVGSSYIFASARDWARMGLLMLEQGKINNQRILSQEWVVAAQTPNNSDNEPRYGYQFWLNSGSNELRWPSLPVGSFAMSGSKNQRVMMIPSHNTVVVRLGWSSHYPINENVAKILATLE